MTSGYNVGMRIGQSMILVIGLITCLLASFPAQILAQTLPAHVEGEIVSDLSGELPDAYLRRMEARVRQYPYRVEVVYLPGTKGLHLGAYAAKLFKHWKLPADSMLVVVALDRRKMGVHAGDELKAKLKADAQDQEVPLPEASPGQSPQPQASGEAPLDMSEAADHLDLVPQAIDQVSEALKAPDQPKASAKPPSPPPETEDELPVSQQGSLPRRDVDVDLGQFAWVLWLLGAAALGAGGWFGFVLWRRLSKTQAMVTRYSQQGQQVYAQLEEVYESLESVMPDFHGYLGETETKLQLFLRSMRSLEEDYEAIFDAYDEEVKLLGTREGRGDAIEFFRELEAKLAEGKALHEQALTVLGNLKDVRAANQQLFAQADSKRQAFSQEISEIRKHHPALKLSKIQQGYQNALNELQRLERQNERDPLGVEKKLKDWRKQLSKMENETRTLPHLWAQFDGDLKARIKGLKGRIGSGGTSNQSASLAEIERLHRTLLQAIEQGDLNTLSRFNDIFTRKLQQLEAEV